MKARIRTSLTRSTRRARRRRINPLKSLSLDLTIRRSSQTQPSRSKKMSRHSTNHSAAPKTVRQAATVCRTLSHLLSKLPMLLRT